MQTTTTQTDCKAEATAFVRNLKAARRLKQLYRSLDHAIFVQAAASENISGIVTEIEAVRREIAQTSAQITPVTITPVKFFGIDEVSA